MNHRLSEMLTGADISGEVPDLAVTGASADSRKVASGNVYFALPGTRVHGKEFVAAAVEAGAVAVVSDQAVDAPVPVMITEDVRGAYAKAVTRAAGPVPGSLVGITGTSGKSSIVSFVRQIWAASGITGATIGTLGVGKGEAILPGALTTPDPAELAKTLAELKAEDIDHAALEASSHGLDQRRLDGLTFDAVGFSNLSRDHLDYHADMDAYRDAKLRLFRDLMKDGGSAVVNCDDPEHMPFMFAALDRGATLMTVGREGAHIEISDITREGYGQRVRGKRVGEPMEFHLPLTGEFQVSNAIVAAALAMATGVESEAAIDALNGLKGAKGRMELVAEHNNAGIFVDYSHKPAALESALTALRPYVTGRLIVVFGAGGDRDKGKRPLMGKAASTAADLVYVTDDNPRTEDPATIRSEILAEVPQGREVGDRGEAIKSAIAELGAGDLLLVAGKGHEDYQIVGNEKRTFSDHETILAALRA